MQPLQAIHPKLFIAITHLVGAGAVALVLGAGYALAYRPITDQHGAYEFRSEQLRGLLANSIDARREHVQLKKEYKELLQRIAQTQRQAPIASGESQFLADATRIAAESGLEIDDYRRGRTRHLPNHSELEITLSTTGGHPAICRFLAEMDQLPRAKRAARLTIESSDTPTTYPMEVAYTLFFGLASSDSTNQRGQP